MPKLHFPKNLPPCSAFTAEMHIEECEGCPEIPQNLGPQDVKPEGGEEEGQEPHTAGFPLKLGFPTSQQDRLCLPVLPVLHGAEGEP